MPEDVEAGPPRAPRPPAQRWALFGASLASLLLMTYAGVLLAFSVPLTDTMLHANPDVPPSGRVVVVPIADPATVATHASGGEAKFLLAGERASFPASATRVEMGRALAYVAPTDGVYEPANLTLVDVPSANGTSNYTIDLAAIAGGASGWIVMGSGEDAPRFFANDEVLGEGARFVSGGSLGITFGAGFLGFLLPLVALVVTHRPAGKGGAPPALCRECGVPMPASDDFCLRCGAYRTGE